MILSGSAPFTLRENRVSYLIPGGEMIDAFYGHPVRENCMQSQAWIASTTYSALGGDNSGLSYLSPEYGDQTLKQVLDARGKEFMGEDHVARWGNTPGFSIANELDDYYIDSVVRYPHASYCVTTSART